MQRPSCVSCHRRKLKCSREDEGCSNCRRSGQACEYPAAEARARGKRGPYQKRATKRERDLSEELKATEAKYKELASRMEEQLRGQPILPPTSISDEYDSSRESCISSNTPYPDYLCMPEIEQAHPPVDQMFQLWHVFITKVHPVTCLVHRPSLEGKIFTTKTGIHTESDSLSTLMYSIYFAAVTSTTSAEAQLRFGEEKSVLLDRYQNVIEKFLAVAHVTHTPDFMTLQALILYIICFRRQEGGHQLWPLFGLAVRMAQLLQLGSDDADSQFTQVEIQFRRRIWWTICWLEKRCAEDVVMQTTSIMSWGASCTLPISINDIDLDPSSQELPQPRLGVADNTLCLMRFEILQLFDNLQRTKPDLAIEDENQRQINVIFRKETLVSNTKARLERDVLQYCSITRPFDWLVLKFVEAVLSKAELMGRTSGMTENEAFRLSLITMKNTYLIQTEPIGAAWAWSSRDYVQSHALIKLVTELCKGTSSNVDPANIDDAWHFIELVVARIPPARRRDPTVSPIIYLMAHARRRRASSFSESAYHPQQINSTTKPFHDSPAESLIGKPQAIQPLQMFPDAWAENAITWGDSFLAAAVPSPEYIIPNDIGMQSLPVDNTSVYPIISYPSVDSTVNNIDWNNWDCSPDVYNTPFVPS